MGSPDLWGEGDLSFNPIGKWGVRDKSNRSILLGYPYKNASTSLYVENLSSSKSAKYIRFNKSVNDKCKFCPNMFAGL